MSWKYMTSVVALWVALPGGAEALSLIAWTDADRIEKANCIVIGTVAQDGDMSVVTAEKEPDTGRSNKVIWVQKDEDHGMNPISGLFHITEGSPRWRLYHALLDPEPLLKDPDFSSHPEAAQVLGYLFDPGSTARQKARSHPQP